MYGSHLSIAGGMQNALYEAQRLGMDCVQVFTKNQRQWRVPPLTDEQVRLWHEALRETKIKCTVSHDSYLINPATPDAANRKRSIDLFRDELERCEALGIPWLVAHPGAHLGSGEDAGLERVAAALNQLHGELPGYAVVTCLEVTAGQGTGLGARFEHLKRIIDLTDRPERVAVCLDTAHMLEAGYDLTSAGGARGVLAELDSVLGLERVRVIHMNDSKTPRGSRVDRHAHIGDGHVSLDAFGVFVRHKLFKKVPKILETAKEDAPDGRPWDLINLEQLKALGKPGAAKKKSVKVVVGKKAGVKKVGKRSGPVSKKKAVAAGAKRPKK